MFKYSIQIYLSFGSVYQICKTLFFKLILIFQTCKSELGKNKKSQDNLPVSPFSFSFFDLWYLEERREKASNSPMYITSALELGGGGVQPFFNFFF